MEIKAELKQPYMENERINFIVEQNHKNGYEIRQVETTYEVEEEVPYTEIETEEIQVPVLDEEGNPVLDEESNQTFETKTIEKEVVKYRTETIEKTGYNLEAWGYTEEEKQEQERERLNLLSMTKREMFLGLYQAKGITPDMLKAQITDPQALIEFEYANDYYRGNPLIDVIGGQLGFTSEQLDKFFETKDYHYLKTCKLTINATPTEATVTGAGAYPYGTVVDVVVECEGYVTHTETVTLTEDKTSDIKLDEVIDASTTDTTESDVSI